MRRDAVKYFDRKTEAKTPSGGHKRTWILR